jgi:hypothetical protein
VITRVRTKKVGPTMLDTDFNPTPMTTSPARTSTPKSGGGAVVSGSG